MEQINVISNTPEEQKVEPKQFTLNENITQMIILILLCIMSLQPLVGLFTRIDYPTDAEIFTGITRLFLRKTEWIRYIGYISLVAAILIILLKCNISFKTFLLTTFRKKPWNICFLLLFLWVCFSSFVIAPYRVEALNGESLKFEGLFSIIAYVGFFSLASLLTNRQYKRFWMTFCVTVSVVLAACALYSLNSDNPVILTYANRQLRSTTGRHLAATFIQYNHYAYYLCMMIVMSAGLYLTEKKRILRVVYLVFMGFQSYALAINGTRGGYLASFIGLTVLTCFLIFRKEVKKTNVVVMWLVFVGAALGASETFLKRFLSIFGDLGGVIQNGDQNGDYGTGRWRLWKTSIQLIKYRPLVGYGTNMSYYALNQLANIADMPHNEYLQHTVDYGLIGGLLYLGGLFSLFVSCIKKIKKLPVENVLLGCVAIAYAVSAFFGVTVVEVVPFFYIALGLVKWDACVDTE